MSNLYLDRKGMGVREENGALRVQVPGCEPYSVPLKLVDHVVVAASVVCDTGTLQRSVAAGVGWILLHPRHEACSVGLCGIGGEPKRRIGQMRAVADAGFRERVQKRLVETKLYLQAGFLRRAAAGRNDLRAELWKGAGRLENAAQGLRSRDVAGEGDSRAGLRLLMGVEGAAANAYFVAFGQLFAPSLTFTCRNRRPPRDPVNVCLSLGYTLIHAEAVRAAALAGLEPALGFLHQPEARRESLACDLVETERATVEEFVYVLFRDGQLRPEHFRTSGMGEEAGGKRCLLGKAGRQAYYEGVEPVLEGARRRLRRRAEYLGRLVGRFHE